MYAHVVCSLRPVRRMYIFQSFVSIHSLWKKLFWGDDEEEEASQTPLGTPWFSPRTKGSQMVSCRASHTSERKQSIFHVARLQITPAAEQIVSYIRGKLGLLFSFLFQSFKHENTFQLLDWRTIPTACKCRQLY